MLLHNILPRRYQHIADAGISSLVLVAYGLVSAGAGVWLVAARTSQQKRLQLLCGVSPLMYWTAALTWDVIVSHTLENRKCHGMSPLRYFALY